MAKGFGYKIIFRFVPPALKKVFVGVSKNSCTYGVGWVEPACAHCKKRKKFLVIF